MISLTTTSPKPANVGTSNLIRGFVLALPTRIEFECNILKKTVAEA